MKILAAISLLLLSTLAAYGQYTGGIIGGSVGGPDYNTVTPIFSGGINAAPSTSAANFFSLTSGYSSTYAASTAVVADSLAVQGYIRGMSVNLSQNVGGSSTPTYTIALFDNAVATGLTCTIGSGASTCTNDTIVPVAVADKLAWGITPGGTPNSLTAPPGILVTAFFYTGASHYRIPIFMGSQGTIAPNTGTTFLGPGRVSSATEINVSGIINGNGAIGSGAGNIQSMYVGSSGTPGGTATYTATLEKNGSDTTITCQLTSAVTVCNDTAHTVTVSAGDTISCKIVAGGSGGTARNISCGISYNPNNNSGTRGLGLIFMNSINAIPSVNSTQYLQIAGNSAANATEANVPNLGPTIPSPHTLTLSGLIVAQSNFSATAHRAMTLRSGAGATSVTCSIPFSPTGLTIGGVSNTPACQDTSHSLALTTTTPLLDLQSVDTSDTGTTPTWFKSTVMYQYQ